MLALSVAVLGSSDDTIDISMQYLIFGSIGVAVIVIVVIIFFSTTVILISCLWWHHNHNRPSQVILYLMYNYYIEV